MSLFLLTASAPLISFRLLIALFATLLFLSCLSNSFAQDNDAVSLTEISGGTLYYIAFPDTVTNTYDARYPHQLLSSRSFTLMIYSPVAQQVRVGQANGAKEEIHIGAGQIVEFNTESIGVPLITAVNQPQTNVLQIEAAFPVIVYAYMGTAFGVAAFTPIPVESWGQEYVAATWPGEVVRDIGILPGADRLYRSAKKEAPSQVLIIAANNNTQVIIQATEQLRECSGCDTVTLNAGEAYLVQSVVDTNAPVESQSDLAGTRITANKRIGVVSGNTRVMHNSAAKPALAENSPKDLVAEWLSPVEQFGTEFVFTPTWDEQRQHDGLDSTKARKCELVRVYGASDEITEVFYRNELDQDIPASNAALSVQEFTHENICAPIARAYHTTKATYAVLSPESVINMQPVDPWDTTPDTSYSAWSTYMVELVPRERWTSFAPVRAPRWPPTGMKHYLNVVADTNHQYHVYIRQDGGERTLFPFNRGRVPGTDLLWGSIPINVDVSYFIEGDYNARFTGHVYGMIGGNEQLRSGRTKKDDDSKDASINGGSQGKTPEVLRTVEYEEDVALSYGYPLASARCIPVEADEYIVETSMNCEGMEVTITAVALNAVGLRSIGLLTDSSENTRIEFIEPVNPVDIHSQRTTEVKLLLTPISPRKNASGVLVFTDRSCNSKRWRVEYAYEAEDAEFNPANELNFGEVPLNGNSGEKVVTITNPLDRDLIVKRLSFVFGNQRFTVTRTLPDFQWQDGNDSTVLASGDSLQVWVESVPNEERRYLDSLRVEFSCVEMTLPVRVKVIQPCIYVNYLNFGTLQSGVLSSPLRLKICNTGNGTTTFIDPYLTWEESAFEVAPAELDKLKTAALVGPSGCVEIEVRFRAPSQTGPYQTIAQVWSNTPAITRTCRDSSIWLAHVIDTATSVPSESVLEGYEVSSLTPNPTSGKAVLRFQLGRNGATRVRVFDAEGRVVATLADERLSAGEHRVEWDAAGYPSGKYYIRVQSGEWTGTASLILAQ